MVNIFFWAIVIAFLIFMWPEIKAKFFSLPPQVLGQTSNA